MLKPFNKALAGFAAALRLVFVVIMGLNALIYLGYLHVVDSAHPDATFNEGYGISLVPFGMHCVATGYLFYQSGIVPKLIAVLFALAGAGYLTFMWPSLGEHLFFPYLLTLAVLGEGSLTLWLLAFGVRAEGKALSSRWCARA